MLTYNAQWITVAMQETWSTHVERAIDQHITVVDSTIEGSGWGDRLARLGVLGSDGVTTYEVQVRATEARRIEVRCTCPAGDAIMRCKHAAAALMALGILERPHTDAPTPALSIVAGTDHTRRSRFPSGCRVRARSRAA